MNIRPVLWPKKQAPRFCTLVSPAILTCRRSCYGIITRSTHQESSPNTWNHPSMTTYNTYGTTAPYLEKQKTKTKTLPARNKTKKQNTVVLSPHWRCSANNCFHFSPHTLPSPLNNNHPKKIVLLEVGVRSPPHSRAERVFFRVSPSDESGDVGRLPPLPLTPALLP